VSGGSALEKVADMQTQIAREPTGARSTPVVSKRIPSHDDGTPLGPTPSRHRRHGASILLARLPSALRGDKYMLGAYPPEEER
jgi:hypothetical protein